MGWNIRGLCAKAIDNVSKAVDSAAFLASERRKWMEVDCVSKMVRSGEYHSPQPVSSTGSPTSDWRWLLFMTELKGGLARIRFDTCHYMI